MKEYRVIWEIDISAESPQDAARQALEIQRDPRSLATVFDVVDPDGTMLRVDLLDPAGRSSDGRPLVRMGLPFAGRVINPSWF